MFRSLWQYRAFILGSVAREIRARYRGSLLGLGWVVLTPLALILVYTLVFSKVMALKLPGVEGGFAYSIFLCAGLLPWGFFAEVLQRSQSVFLDHGNLIKKASFPRICLPAVVLLSAGFNFLVIFALFVAFLLAVGQFPGWVGLALVPVLVLQVALSAGLGVLLGTLNVFFRDVGQFTGTLLHFWFWLTPVVYPAAILPGWAQDWLRLNPLAPLMQAYQDIFLYQRLPDLAALWPAVAFAAFALWIGLRAFRRHAADMADEL